MQVAKSFTPSCGQTWPPLPPLRVMQTPVLWRSRIMQRCLMRLSFRQSGSSQSVTPSCSSAHSVSCTSTSARNQGVTAAYYGVHLRQYIMACIRIRGRCRCRLNIRAWSPSLDPGLDTSYSSAVRRSRSPFQTAPGTGSYLWSPSEDKPCRDPCTLCSGFARTLPCLSACRRPRCAQK
jgi:hypothetical protein